MFNKNKLKGKLKKLGHKVEREAKRVETKIKNEVVRQTEEDPIKREQRIEVNKQHRDDKNNKNRMDEARRQACLSTEPFLKKLGLQGWQDPKFNEQLVGCVLQANQLSQNKLDYEKVNKFFIAAQLGDEAQCWALWISLFARVAPRVVVHENFCQNPDSFKKVFSEILKNLQHPFMGHPVNLSIKVVTSDELGTALRECANIQNQIEIAEIKQQQEKNQQEQQALQQQDNQLSQRLQALGVHAPPPVDDEEQKQSASAMAYQFNDEDDTDDELAIEGEDDILEIDEQNRPATPKAKAKPK